MADALAFDPAELRVLVVDDNQQMRTIIRTMLGGFGVKQITTAIDGADALGKLGGAVFDVAICDWLMAPMDGLAFVQEVRRHPTVPLRSLPIMMLTAQKEMRNVLDARSAGVDAYVVKPVSASQLWARLETVVQRAKKVAPAEPGVVAKAIVAATGSLTHLADAYRDVLRLDCEDLARGMGLLLGSDWDNRDIWNAMFKKAHDLKGQAGSFDYTLATDLAEVLCELLRPVREVFSRRNLHPAELKTVLQANIGSLQLIVRENIVGDGGPEGRDLLQEIDAKRRRLLAAWGIAP
jgi:two-component system, chemotaxis family, chemotaxis protein CheY